MRRSTPFLIIAALALASAADAQTAAPAPVKINWSPAPAISIADPRLAIASPYGLQNPSVDRHGVAQTAIDHAIGPTSQASVGYLCGLQPGPNEAGGPASSYHPEGTFLGGQFKLAFK
jgi:hypothetical protein